MRYLLLIATLSIFSCKNNSSNTEAADSTKQTAEFETKQLSGVYFDTVPCNNCVAGIGTKIYLKPDSTFIREQNSTDQKVSYDIGKWSVTDSVLKLNTVESPKQFKIINYTELKVLDNEGKAMEDTSKPITMRRNNVPFRPLQPIPVEGLFSANGDTINIHICALERDYPAFVSPAALAIKTAYKKATNQKNQQVYAYVAGHFELRPSLTDTTTNDFFVIERFTKFEVGKMCK